MSRVLYPYPRVDSPAALSEIGAKVTFQWLDEHGREFNVQEASDCPGAIELLDFLPAEMVVKLHVSVYVAYPRKLFGKYVSDDAEIGIAVRYRFPELGIQSVLPFQDQSFLRSSGSISASSVMSIRKKTLRKVSYFEVFLYLKQKGSIRGPYASVVGADLGVLDACSLITGGSGFDFPISIVSEGINKPLWRIESQVTEESLESNFEDAFMVFVNEDNPAFSSVGMDHNAFSPMLLEMFCSVCTALLCKIKELDRSISWDLNGDSSGESLICRVRFFAQTILPGVTENDIRSMSVDQVMNDIRDGLYRMVRDSLTDGGAK